MFRDPLVRLICIVTFIFFTWIEVQSTGINFIDGKVISVKDGDTIEILVGSATVKVRLFGIDCPEKTQDFGTKAREYTSMLCFSKKVKVKVHGKDKYRRTLGTVYLPDGSNLNQLLVLHGYAWRYKYSTDKDLLEKETIARRDKAGLWSHAKPTAPWEFRRQGKAKKVNPQ